MHLLLDTHIFLWWERDDRKLPQKARSMIRDADRIYISSVSIWEASIKTQLGKLSVDIEQLIEKISSDGFIELPLTTQHVAALSKLPNLHQDPFDRILIAQALSEPLKFLTADKVLRKYSDIVEVV